MEGGGGWIVDARYISCIFTLHCDGLHDCLGSAWDSSGLPSCRQSEHVMMVWLKVWLVRWSRHTVKADKRQDGTRLCLVDLDTQNTSRNGVNELNAFCGACILLCWTSVYTKRPCSWNPEISGIKIRLESRDSHQGSRAFAV